MIIEAVKASTLPASGFAYFAVLAGVFVTAFYSFRMYFLVFHGKERFNTDPHAAAHGHIDGHSDGHADGHDDGHGHGGGLPHESPAVITLPLVLLAIPSVLIGMFTIGPMLFGDFFQTSISVFEPHNAMEVLAEEFHGPVGMALHALTTMPFWLALAGVAAAYYCYLVNPAVPASALAVFTDCSTTSSISTASTKSSSRVARVRWARGSGSSVIRRSSMVWWSMAARGSSAGLPVRFAVCSPASFTTMRLR
jgi:NADH-quinone oxidoreductase subunit L